MTTEPMRKHYLALIDQAQQLGWDGQKAQTGEGPSLIAFWQGYVTRLQQAVTVLSRIANRVGHPSTSVDEDPATVAGAVDQSLRYFRGREEMLDHLLARINLLDQLETERHQQMPSLWRTGLAQIIEDAQVLCTHQDFMEVPKDSPTYERLLRIESEARELLILVNSPMTQGELAHWTDEEVPTSQAQTANA